MSWADKVKATALAAVAGRTTAAVRTFVDLPWTWNPHEVWLTRVKQPRDLAAQPPPSEQSSNSRLDVAARD